MVSAGLEQGFFLIAMMNFSKRMFENVITSLYMFSKHLRGLHVQFRAAILELDSRSKGALL